MTIFGQVSNQNRMISSMADSRYITPDYLSPLSSTDKNGKSPLQLLAQTCSQIGADSGTTVAINSPAHSSSSTKLLHDKRNLNNNSIVNHAQNSFRVGGEGTISSPELKHQQVSFKPYEGGNIVEANTNATPIDSIVSNDKSSLLSSNNRKLSCHKPSFSPSARSGSSSRGSPKSVSGRSPRTTPHANETTQPVIRSGMEVLAASSNPAFRLPFLSGIPSSFQPLPASSNTCRDPYCRDPSCPTALYNAHLISLAAGLSPAYLELLQAHRLGMTNQTTPSSPNLGRPYICNWINGRDGGYCGKTHGSADELLQHLRTHTSISTSDSGAAAAATLLNSSLYSSSLLGGSGSTTAAAAALAAANLQQQTSLYGNALSSLAASARFHPYSKPVVSNTGPVLPSPVAAMAGLSPGVAAAYSPVASLYALYGSRLAGQNP